MEKLIGTAEIQQMIIELRGKRVILDSDLAKLYQVSTKRLMEQVKRNLKRFPPDFMFQLTKEEWSFLKSQIATSKNFAYYKQKLPFVFSRNGANMVSAVLKSPIAVQRSIQIMRAFSTLEEILSKKKRLIVKSPEIIRELSVHSRAITHLFQKDKINTREIETIKKIFNEMISILQKMIFKME